MHKKNIRFKHVLIAITFLLGKRDGWWKADNEQAIAPNDFLCAQVKVAHEKKCRSDYYFNFASNIIQKHYYES